jgi:methyltransferase (TIGR00027 family)
MSENQASITAMVTAFCRAWHSTHDAPRIFDDFLADKLFSADEYLFLGKRMSELLRVVDQEKAAENPDQETALACVMQKYSASISLGRARYTEDNLKEALKKGVKQYVILGAGLDTFAFREPEMVNRLQVFEVDFSATQEDKIRRIKSADWKIPEQLHFVPVDFNKENLADALGKFTYDPKALSFFSWLGVTYYLPIESVMETLRAIAGIAPKGSTIVFDYLDRDAFNPEKAGRRITLLREITKRTGEPMITGFDPDTLAAELNKVGFQLQENLSPSDIEKRFFQGRKDDYHAYENVHFALAVVE